MEDRLSEEVGVLFLGAGDWEPGAGGVDATAVELSAPHDANGLLFKVREI